MNNEQCCSGVAQGSKYTLSCSGGWYASEFKSLKVLMLTLVIDRRTIVTCLVLVFLSDNVVIDNLGAYVRRWKTIMEQPHIRI